MAARPRKRSRDDAAASKPVFGSPTRLGRVAAWGQSSSATILACDERSVDALDLDGDFPQSHSRMRGGALAALSPAAKRRRLLEPTNTPGSVGSCASVVRGSAAASDSPSFITSSPRRGTPKAGTPASVVRPGPVSLASVFSSSASSPAATESPSLASSWPPGANASVLIKQLFSPMFNFLGGVRTGVDDLMGTSETSSAESSPTQSSWRTPDDDVVTMLEAEMIKSVEAEGVELVCRLAVDASFDEAAASSRLELLEAAAADAAAEGSEVVVSTTVRTVSTIEERCQGGSSSEDAHAVTTTTTTKTTTTTTTTVTVGPPAECVSAALSSVDLVSTYIARHSHGDGSSGGALSPSSSNANQSCWDDDFDPYHFMATLPSIPAHRRPPVGLPVKPHAAPRLSLVLDLDETLVHCSTSPDALADEVFTLQFNEVSHCVYLRKRPHLETFLQAVSQLFEVVVFTASHELYASRVLDLIDPGRRYISHRLFRDSCVTVEGNYVKDLHVVGRDLGAVVIVDNSPYAYGYQLDNGIPITSWFDDQNDTELLELAAFLRRLNDSPDVRPVVRNAFSTHRRVERARR